MQKTTGIFFLFLCVLMILIAGCTSTGSTSAAVSTPTPQIVYVTVLVTPTQTPTIAKAQDPIIGVWRYNRFDYDFRYQFNSDGSLQIYFKDPVGVVNSLTDTWNSNGQNSYIITSPSGEKQIWVYIPSSDSLFETTNPTMSYTRYQGSVKIDSSSQSTPTPSGTSSKSLTFSGNGDDTKSFTVTGGGGFLITGSNSGRSNFIVHITDSSGNVVEFVFNEIGPYSGTKIVHLGAGKYYLGVQAEGSWTISLTAS